MLVVAGGRVLDPAQDMDEIANVFIRDGVVVGVGQDEVPAGAAVLDARGLVVTPGLIDIHVHLREPGREDEETIESGCMAAARGGFTTVACMPNTSPALADRSAVEYVIAKARVSGKARVLPVGAVTTDREGRELADIGDLLGAGAVAVSDDGSPVSDAHLMRRALEYCKAFGVPVIDHCEDLSLSSGGVMHEGLVSTQLGLAPIPAAAEEVMVARDIILTRLTGGRLHVAHVSTAGSVGLIRQAKDEGLQVTAEVTPHHLVLCDEDVMGFDPNTKVNPPLRSAADREAVREALRDGTIDAIASDHAPHSPEEKLVEYDRAAFGMIGLETTLGIVLTELVEPGALDLRVALERLSLGPARVIRSEGGRLTKGAPADVTLLALNEEWVVNPADFFSKSRNCPFAGRKLRGRAVKTLLGGRAVELPLERS